jgi:uncharacterized membrane protein (Fun14 family)
MADTNAETTSDQGAVRREFPRWKKALLGGALFLVVAGAALKSYGYFRGDSRSEDGAASQEATRTTQDTGGLGHGLVGPSGGGQSFFPEATRVPRQGVPDAEASSAASDWSPALMKGGMSFIVGFCVGYAFRTFFRISAVMMGLVFLAVFGLSYAGVVQVDWTAINTFFDRAVAAVKDQVGSFQTFVAGSLPSAGLAGAGLFTGFKKH